MTRPDTDAVRQDAGHEDAGVVPTSGCALATLRADVDPIGTATPFDDLLLVRHAGPWARIAAATPGLPSGLRPPIARAAKVGRAAHALLVDADDVPPAPEGTVRVAHVRRPPGAARAYQRSAWHLPLATLEADVEALLAGERPDGGEPLPVPERELLVCTHGERDGCCGRFGEAAYLRLRDRHASTGPSAGLPAGLAVWRVSHFGGHRFAPTLLDLPDGRSWGRLNEATLDAIATRSRPPADLAGAYRGWAALPNAVQVAERDLFAEHGWAWRDARLDAELGAADADGTRTARLRYALPGRAPRTREATLSERPGAAVPASCGATAAPTVRYACAWKDPALTPARR